MYDKAYIIQYVVEDCDQIGKIKGRADAEKRDQLELARWRSLKNRVN